MSGSTRILVIPLKKLILALCVIIAFIIIAAIYILSDKEPESHPTNAAGQNNSINTSVTYSPGVYTSSLMLNGNPVDIQVTALNLLIYRNQSRQCILCLHHPSMKLKTL